MHGITFKTFVNWLVQFAPILLFTYLFRSLGFTAATSVLLITTALGLVYVYVTEKKIPIFPLFSGLMVIGFGVSALYFHNPKYLVWEFTFYNSVFAIAVVTEFARGRILLKEMFDSLFALTDKGWRAGSYRFLLFFIGSALFNEFIFAVFGFHTWVYYRTVAIPIDFIFALSQLPLARRERLPEATAWGFRK